MRHWKIMCFIFRTPGSEVVHYLKHNWKQFAHTIYPGDPWLSEPKKILSIQFSFVLLEAQQTRVSLYSCSHPSTLSLSALPLCPPSTFHLCSVGRSTVTQGCHVQEKLPSNNMQGCKTTVYSPPPHLMRPLPLFSSTLSLCRGDGVAWEDSEGNGGSCSLIKSDNRYRKKKMGGVDER